MPEAGTIRCLIVDDEPPARQLIRGYLEEIPGISCLGECETAMEALLMLERENCDLLFLDVKMPRITGLDLLKSLRYPPKTILTTAYADYALEGYDLDVVDYLLKPIRFDRFWKAIHKAFPSSAPIQEALVPVLPDRPFVYFRANRKMVKVWLDDLLFVESLKDYVRIVTRQGTILSKQSLSSVESMLPAHRFARVHRSYLVSLHEVSSFSADSLVIDQHSIPIGKLYRLSTMQSLNPPDRIQARKS